MLILKLQPPGAPAPIDYEMLPLVSYLVQKKWRNFQLYLSPESNIDFMFRFSPDREQIEKIRIRALVCKLQERRAPRLSWQTIRGGRFQNPPKDEIYDYTIKELTTLIAAEALWEGLRPPSTRDEVEKFLEHHPDRLTFIRNAVPAITLLRRNAEFREDFPEEMENPF